MHLSDDLRSELTRTIMVGPDPLDEVFKAKCGDIRVSVRERELELPKKAGNVVHGLLSMSMPKGLSKKDKKRFRAARAVLVETATGNASIAKAGA